MNGKEPVDLKSVEAIQRAADLIPADSEHVCYFAFIIGGENEYFHSAVPVCVKDHDIRHGIVGPFE